MASDPFRGYQLGLAMFDAASKDQAHPLSPQIGRTARNIAG